MHTQAHQRLVQIQKKIKRNRRALEASEIAQYEVIVVHKLFKGLTDADDAQDGRFKDVPARFGLQEGRLKDAFAQFGAQNWRLKNESARFGAQEGKLKNDTRDATTGATNEKSEKNGRNN